MVVVRTSSKGQIVIPKGIRDDLGIESGSKLSVEEVEHTIVLHPLPANPVEYLCGIIKDGPSLSKELIRERIRDNEKEKSKIARLTRRAKVSEKRR